MLIYNLNSKHYFTSQPRIADWLIWCDVSLNAFTSRRRYDKFVEVEYSKVKKRAFIIFYIYLKNKIMYLLLHFIIIICEWVICILCYVPCSYNIIYFLSKSISKCGLVDMSNVFNVLLYVCIININICDFCIKMVLLLMLFNVQCSFKWFVLLINSHLNSKGF